MLTKRTIRSRPGRPVTSKTDFSPEILTGLVTLPGAGPASTPHPPPTTPGVTPPARSIFNYHISLTNRRKRAWKCLIRLGRFGVLDNSCAHKIVVDSRILWAQNHSIDTPLGAADLTYYLITSTNGPIMGIYPGATKAEAMAALANDAGSDTDPAGLIVQSVERADAADVMSALDSAAFDADQDWDNESTTWTLPDGAKIRVSGSTVEVI